MTWDFNASLASNLSGGLGGGEDLHNPAIQPLKGKQRVLKKLLGFLTGSVKHSELIVQFV